jgi:hypothetical protein
MPTKYPPFLLAAAISLALAACQRTEEPKVAETPAPQGEVAAPQGPSELDWARAALERNPTLEVLATDASAGVFTVRDRGTGNVQTVRIPDLAAVPVAALGAPAETAPVDDVPDGDTATAAAGSAEDPALDYTVERSGGQVRVSGPGVSIVSAGTTTPAPQAAPSRNVDPIICEGTRMLRLNDRNISVQGDAVTARGGCELHITNSRISATGTGLVVLDATVVVTNSEITGGAASFDAGAGARLILQGATLKGATRRDERADVQELGNNTWR